MSAAVEVHSNSSHINNSAARYSCRRQQRNPSIAVIPRNRSLSTAQLPLRQLPRSPTPPLTGYSTSALLYRSKCQSHRGSRASCSVYGVIYFGCIHSFPVAGREVSGLDSNAARHVPRQAHPTPTLTLFANPAHEQKTCNSPDIEAMVPKLTHCARYRL